MSRRVDPARPVSEYRTWRKGAGISYERLSRLVSAYDLSATPRYLEDLENGVRRPDYELAEVLWKICNGAVSIHYIMTFKRLMDAYKRTLHKGEAA
jgi:transcriptional regulator with XRE-family HTH domain